VSGVGGTIRGVTELQLRTYGPADGRAVLALHGVTAHAARWRVLAEALPELRFIAVDLRGHGHSPWVPPWHLEQHVADALSVLDELGLSRVVVFGHSFGGAIAVHLARAAPERVERLVLLDPAIGLHPQDMLDTAEETRADESYPDREAARADRAQRWPWAADELVEDELAENLVQDGDRWRYRYSRAAVVAAWGEMARPALTPPAQLPTLLMPAAQEDYVDPAWVRACQEELGARLTVCEIDAGHILHLERTALVAKQIQAFLGEEGAGG
jgi:lipase